MAGDTLSLLLSLFIVLQGVRLGASGGAIAGMLFNVMLDWLIGLVPIAGDILDFAFRCNRRNMDILRCDLARR